MNIFQRQLSLALAWYGAQAPAHRGKWRVVESLLDAAGLREGYQGVTVARRAGRLFELDLNSHIDRRIYYHNTYESWDTLFLETVLRPHWVMLDIGANIGWHSLMASKHIGAEGRIFAFEISPDEMKKFQRNLSLNNLTSVEPLLIAMSDAPGVVAVTETRGAGMTAMAVTEAEGKIEIAATSLDSFVEERNLERMDLIKVDIEGAEGKFLAGAKVALRRFSPLMMMEFNPSALEHFGTSLEDIVKALRELGYSVFKTNRHGLNVLTRLPEGREYHNVIALPAQTRTHIGWNELVSLVCNRS